jgi:AcrR family transcriptional regulator
MVNPRIRELRQEEILQAAHSLALLEGVSAVTISSIAQRAHVSRPAVYQYFSSVESVLAELLIDAMADLANAIDQKLQNCKNPLECISHWLDATLDFYISPDHAYIKEISLGRLPEDSLALINVLHGQFMTSLVNPVSQLRSKNVTEYCGYIFALAMEGAVGISQGRDRDEVHGEILHFVSTSISVTR